MRNVVLFLTIAASVSTVKADSVTYTVTPEAGDFSYSIVLTNTGYTGGTLFDLFLSIPLDIGDIDTNAIGTPVGWGDPTGGFLFFGPNGTPLTSFVEWADDASGLYDVGIGASLTGFSFTASQEIAGSITFALNGSTFSETAQPIAAVPEPSHVQLIFIALLSCCCVLRRINIYEVTR